MYIKRFNFWNKTKIKINLKDNFIIPRNGEIRWANIGVNVGSEIDGKGEKLTRPVLIVKVISRNTSLVLPMSSKINKSKGVYVLDQNNKVSSIYLNQVKVISNKRILDRVSKISDKKLFKIKQELCKFILN
jgi:mRNA interferase MazF